MSRSERYAEKRLMGECYDCSDSAEPGRTRCSRHLTADADSTKRYLKTDKGHETVERLKPYQAAWKRQYRKRKKSLTN